MGVWRTIIGPARFHLLFRRSYEGQLLIVQGVIHNRISRGFRVDGPEGAHGSRARVKPATYRTFGSVFLSRATKVGKASWASDPKAMSPKAPRKR